MKHQRHETIEPAGFFLQCPKLVKMVDPMLRRFYMSEEHRGIGGNTEFVCRPMDVEPNFRRDFLGSNFLPDCRVENFRPPSRQTCQADRL
jgi:hypothetical protein